MKALFLILLACALVSCATDPPNPGVTPPPPTVTPLPEVARPSTAKVVPLVRETARALDKVRTENERLRDTVEESAAINEGLGAMLSRSIEDGHATRERLVEIKKEADKEKALNAVLRSTVDGHTQLITDLQALNMDLEIEIGELSATVAVANQRLTDNQTQLDTANSRIRDLSAAHEAAVDNSLKWKDEVAKAQGRIDTEKSWKWRFFWWAVGATILIVGYVALRLYPATRTFIP